MRRRALFALLATIGLLLASAPEAGAYQPVDVVHTERVQVGPYGLTVGFSTWPLRAMRSLDFTFVPDGGLDGLSGTVRMANTTTGIPGRVKPLARHPRKRDVWGLDVLSLPTAGDWTFQFTIDGPEGRGTGTLQHLEVLRQPGPPLALSWSITTLPLFALAGFIAVAWRRTRGRLEPL
jgi:hypothetical protein